MLKSLLFLEKGGPDVRNLAVNGTVDVASLPNCGSQIFKHGDGAVPVNAGICDADTLLQSGGTLRWYLLVTLVDVGLDHDTNDGLLAFAELVSNNLGNLGLVAMVFVGVTYGRASVTST